MPRTLPAMMVSALLTNVITHATADAAALDHPAVSRYVNGWQAHDGAQVLSAFTPEGRYSDPSVRAPLHGAAIAQHVAEHNQARFELLGATQAGNQVELQWTAHWPDQRGDSVFTDTLKLKGNAIESVDSVGVAPAEAAQLVAAYEAMHDHPTVERMNALFTPDFGVFSSTLPPTGLHRDSYIGFLDKLHGTVLRQQEGSRLLLTKDNRLVMHWTLMAGTKRMAAGVDYFTLDQERIRKIVGYY